MIQNSWCRITKDLEKADDENFKVLLGMIVKVLGISGFSPYRFTFCHYNFSW